MSRDLVLDTTPVQSHDQLLTYFRSGEKARAKRGIGTEHEKFVFRNADLQMLSYEEAGGFSDIFQALIDNHGWEPAYDRGKIAALEKDGAAITLEPGGQLELSGAIFKTVFETATEFDNHLTELKALIGDRLTMVMWGLNPFYAPEQVPWMPKARYEIMRRYMATRGDHAHWMMKTTCTVQANFDYTSEADATDMMRTALLISPVVSALFANSPLKEGQPNKMQSYRGYAWTRTDPDRCGFPAFMYSKDWGYADYLEYILDVPMFFIRREEGYIDLAGHSFRDFLEHGYGPYTATMGDFELHISTAFPEIRLKTYIEVRGADGGPRPFVLALPALWKGLLYHEPSRQAAAALFEGVSPEAHHTVFMDAYREGIHAQTTFGSMLALGESLLNLSRAGLDALAAEAGHPSEAAFLEPLFEIIETEISLADALLSDFDDVDGDPAALTSRWAL